MKVQFSPSEARDLVTPYEFEVLYFRLKIARATASGSDASGSPEFVLEAGQERLSPRRELFTADRSAWRPPTPLQIKALLHNFRTIKYVYDSFGLSAYTVRRWTIDGIDRFLLWRQLLELAAVPSESYPQPPLREIGLWDTIPEPSF